MTIDALANGMTEVLSIRELASRRSGAAQLAAFTAHARMIAQASNVELLHEFDEQDDPLMLWVAHREADSRGLAPCLRWGRCTRSSLARSNGDDDLVEPDPQNLFVSWLADMLWLAGRERSWTPLEARWSGLFDEATNSAGWHAHAIRVFSEVLGVPKTFSARLGLDRRARVSTLTATSVSTLGERMALLDMGSMASRLTAYAVSHPDRSGVYTPAQVVQRRLLAYRLFVLAGRQQGLAAQYFSAVTGQPVSRQAFTRQLDAVEASLGKSLRIRNDTPADEDASLSVDGGAALQVGGAESGAEAA